MYNRTDSTGSHIINDILDSHSYTSVYYDILSCWDWLFVCYYILLQHAGYFNGSQFISIKRLFTAVSVMSSVVTITPQFLGVLPCTTYEWT